MHELHGHMHRPFAIEPWPACMCHARARPPWSPRTSAGTTATREHQRLLHHPPLTSVTASLRSLGTSRFGARFVAEAHCGEIMALIHDRVKRVLCVFQMWGCKRWWG